MIGGIPLLSHMPSRRGTG